MTQKIKLPLKEDFYKLYITDNLSIEELKERYKVGRSTIDNWIHTFQIKKPKDLIRICKERANLKKFGYTNVALIPGYRKKTHFSIPMPSYDDFYKNYIVENKSRAELCEHYKVGKSTIDKWISILKIKKPQNLINKSIQNYMLKKYNVNNISQLEEIKQKKEQTMFLNYGVKTAMNLPVVREKSWNAIQTKFGNKGVLGNVEIQQKIKEIIKDKYNVDNVMQLQASKDKRIETNKEKYGKEYYIQTEEGKEQVKNTCLNKYGKDNYFKTEEFEKKKIKTNIIKFGVESYSKTQAFKDFIKEHHDEIQQKVYNTKKQNNSFNKSEDEEKVYQLLLYKFKQQDIVRQYRSEEYPFACDFYIKSLNLYIEYHGSWVHGGKPFVNSVEDKQKLKKWESKVKETNFKGEEKSFYSNAIYVWTKADPKKLKTFIENKLNYKIFYNLEQFYEWYNSI